MNLDVELGFPKTLVNYKSWFLLEEGCLSWVTTQNLIMNETQKKRFTGINVGRLTEFGYHYGSEDKKLIIAKIMAWLFLFDDEFAEGRFSEKPNVFCKKCNRLTEVFFNRVASDLICPFEVALMDINRELSLHAPQEWVHRFGDDLREYFDGCLKEIFFRQNQMTPSLDQYLELRPQSVAGKLAIDLSEFVSDCYINNLDIVGEFKEFREIGALMAGLTNDYYSSFKEALEPMAYNAIVCISRDKKVTIQKSTELYFEIHRAKLQRMFSIQTKLTQSGTCQMSIAIYMEGALHFIQGNYDWAKVADRYNNYE